MKNKIIYLVLGGFVIFLLISCATVIKDFYSYQNAGATRSPNTLSDDKTQINPVKIVLYKIETQNFDKKLSLALSKNIQELFSNSNVEIIKSLETFNEKVILVQNKEGNSATADYAIKGNISGITSSKFRRGGYSTNQLTGQVTYTYPSCVYRAKVSGQFEIYSLTDLKQVLVVPLRRSSRLSIRMIACRKPPTAALIKKTITTKHRKRILNKLAAKGYVKDVRKKDNKYIVQINLGHQNGIRQENKIAIYKTRIVLDKLTQEKKEKLEQVALGIVSDFFEENSAWIVIKNKKQAKNISIGDVVKVHY